MQNQKSPTLQDFMNKPTQVVGVKKIILVASAKGGVGKSTIAANLAIALSKNSPNLNVALVDADIYGPSIANIFGIENLKPAIKNDLLQPIISCGIKIISIANLIESSSAGVWRGPMVTKILYQLIRSIDWQSDGNKVDIMVIDMPPGTGDVYLSIAEKFPIDGVLLVSTPHELAVIDVVKSIDCFKKLNISLIGLVQNMSYLEIDGKKNYIFGVDGAKKIADKLNIEIIADIAIETEISSPISPKVPFIFTSQKANLLENFKNISQKIVEFLKI